MGNGRCWRGAWDANTAHAGPRVQPSRETPVTLWMLGWWDGPGVPADTGGLWGSRGSEHPKILHPHVHPHHILSIPTPGPPTALQRAEEPSWAGSADDPWLEQRCLTPRQSPAPALKAKPFFFLIVPYREKANKK